MKIKGKPKGVGCEMKIVVDADSRITMELEINKGSFKTEVICNARKKGNETWEPELQPQPTDRKLAWNGKNSSKPHPGFVPLHVLRKRGLFFLGMVKIANTIF